VKVTAASALVRGGAAPDAAPVATAARGAVLPASARVGGLYKVEWDKGRFGFVAAADVQPARGKREGTVTRVWQREPPRIVLSPDPAKGAPVVDADKLRIAGKASVPAGPGGDRLRDLFVFVNDQKVFFKVVPDGDSPDIEFATDVPLKPGNNTITVVAREDEEFQSRKTLVVFRRPSAEVAQKK
jgi:carboxyl-terminal processing protease